MTFSKMDGHKFEELISELLKRMGFSVERKSLTGDNGVDIIAYSKHPITGGKYIIQCKNWNQPVGEPVIRDFFGTILNEHAVKGILMTSSNFSTKAREFAEGKNIELIDGGELKKILEQYSLKNENSISSGNFIDDKSFDKERYLYLKSRIEEDRKEKLHYERMQEFFFPYVIDIDKAKINKAGLIDEYLALSEEYIKRFCRGRGGSLACKSDLLYLNCLLLLLKGEIFKAVETYVNFTDVLNEYLGLTNYSSSKFWSRPDPIKVDLFSILNFFSICVSFPEGIQEFKGKKLFYFPNFFPNFRNMIEEKILEVKREINKRIWQEKEINKRIKKVENLRKRLQSPSGRKWDWELKKELEQAEKELEAFIYSNSAQKKENPRTTPFLVLCKKVPLNAVVSAYYQENFEEIKLQLIQNKGLLEILIKDLGGEVKKWETKPKIRRGAIPNKKLNVGRGATPNKKLKVGRRATPNKKLNVDVSYDYGYIDIRGATPDQKFDPKKLDPRLRPFIKKTD